MGQPTTLITGASRGIGRGIGLSLASIGHDLVINYAGNEQAAQAMVDAGTVQNTTPQPAPPRPRDQAALRQRIPIQIRDRQ